VAGTGTKIFVAARYDIVTAGENRVTVVANGVYRWLCKLMEECEIALSATAGNIEEVCRFVHDHAHGQRHFRRLPQERSPD
jgi:hypothetical protein